MCSVASGRYIPWRSLKYFAKILAAGNTAVCLCSHIMKLNKAEARLRPHLAPEKRAKTITSGRTGLPLSQIETLYAPSRAQTSYQWHKVAGGRVFPICHSLCWDLGLANGLGCKLMLGLKLNWTQKKPVRPPNSMHIQHFYAPRCWRLQGDARLKVSLIGLGS